MTPEKPAADITIEIQRLSRHKQLYARRELEEIVRRALAWRGRPGEQVSVSLCLCDDEEMARLNKDWMGKQGPTDVLSFPAAPVPIPGPRCLGDVVISLENVMARNRENRRAARREVRLLFCHGVLHLLGMDHETAAGEAGMRAAQARILNIPEDKAWLDDDAC